MNQFKNEKYEQLSRLESTVTLDRNARLISAKNEIVEIDGGILGHRRLIDLMSSYAAVNFGHMNPAINPFDNLNADLVSYFTPIEAELFAHWLCERINMPDGRVLFQIGGTSAVSASLALAQQVRPGKVVSVAHGFHGLAIDALSASTIAKDCILQETSIRQSTNPTYKIIDYGEEIDDWSDISCIIFEPVQGAAGMIPLDAAWLKSICTAARKAGVVVISDEIQCGYYRCGALSYTQSIGLKVDVTIFGKSMTNGLFPFAAIVYDKALEPKKWKESGVFAHTFQPSAIGCRSAYAVAQYLDSEQINEKISAINDVLNDFSRSLMKRDYVSDIHLLGPSLSMEYCNGSATKIARMCFENDVLVTTGGTKDERFRLMPPITIPITSLQKGLDVLEQAIIETTKKDSRVAGAASVGG